MKKALRISISILLFALAVAITQIPADSVSADTTKASEGDFQIKDNIQKRNAMQLTPHGILDD